MLPKKLLYQTKIESANARYYKSNIVPQNGGLIQMVKQQLLIFQQHLI